MLHTTQKRASEKCNTMREEEKRTPSPSSTNTRMVANGKASNMRPFDCKTFFCVLFILVKSCPFYSLLRTCVLTRPSLCLRRSLLSTCTSCLSLSLARSTHKHTIIAQGHNKKERTGQKRERRASSLTVILPTNIHTHIALTTKTKITLFEYMCAEYVTYTYVSIKYINI